MALDLPLALLLELQNQGHPCVCRTRRRVTKTPSRTTDADLDCAVLLFQKMGVSGPLWLPPDLNFVTYHVCLRYIYIFFADIIVRLCVRCYERIHSHSHARSDRKSSVKPRQPGRYYMHYSGSFVCAFADFEFQYLYFKLYSNRTFTVIMVWCFLCNGFAQFIKCCRWERGYGE